MVLNLSQQMCSRDLFIHFNESYSLHGCSAPCQLQLVAEHNADLNRGEKFYPNDKITIGCTRSSSSLG
jgi:hypothetical protein